MNVFEIIQLAIILAVSIGLHEYAHAYTSYRLGDPTPKLQNRLTPNPLRHIDPIGFLMIFTPLRFGWGKPVQINPMYYKKPRQGELIVALAGPATNMILAIAGMLVILIYTKISNLGIEGIITGNLDIMTTFWIMFCKINVGLAVFNMIPIPPLDGFRLIKMFLHEAGEWIEKYTLYISIFFLFLILGPGSSIIGGFLGNISSNILNFLFTMLGQFFY